METAVRIPDVFKRILKSIETDSSCISWTLTCKKGLFNMKLWQFEDPAEKILCPRQPEKLPEDQRPENPSKQVDTCAAARHSGSPSENLDSINPIPSRKRQKKKTPSKIRRDRKRLEAWKGKRKGLLSDTPACPKSSVIDQEQPGSYPVSPQPSCLEVEQENHRSESNSEDIHLSLSFESESDSAEDPIDYLYEDMCGHCFKEPGPNIKLRACTRCKLVQYCSVKCQKEEWPDHKKLCRIFPQVGPKKA